MPAVLRQYVLPALAMSRAESAPLDLVSEVMLANDTARHPPPTGPRQVRREPKDPQIVRAKDEPRALARRSTNS